MTEVVAETLGWRMKQAEHRYRRAVPADDYLLLRLDGRAFHTYTSDLKRPYDARLMEAMDATMVALLDEIDNARFGYCQSDEISIVVCNWQRPASDDADPRTLKRSDPWLGGVESKVLSLSAAFATLVFNRVRAEQGHRTGAMFDSRLWTFPADQFAEVQNYLLWRQRDCIKNSVTMAAQEHFSHRALHRVNTGQKRALLADLGHPWERLPTGFRQGRMAVRRPERAEISYRDRRDNELHTAVVDRRPFRSEPCPPIGDWVAEFIPTRDPGQ